MSRGTKQRGFRCEDELWDKAKEAAGQRGEHLSDIIRKALEQYVKDNQEEQQ